MKQKDLNSYLTCWEAGTSTYHEQLFWHFNSSLSDSVKYKRSIYDILMSLCNANIDLYDILTLLLEKKQQ